MSKPNYFRSQHRQKVLRAQLYPSPEALYLFKSNKTSFEKGKQSSIPTGLCTYFSNQMHGSQLKDLHVLPTFTENCCPSHRNRMSEIFKPKRTWGPNTKSEHSRPWCEVHIKPQSRKDLENRFISHGAKSSLGDWTWRTLTDWTICKWVSYVHLLHTHFLLGFSPLTYKEQSMRNSRALRYINENTWG